MAQPFDLVITNGRWFDGTGAPSAQRDLGLRGGRVAAIEPSIPADAARERLDARGCWVLPGFVDIHTHYDAELLVAPALRESLRHGVTSVFVGSCSLSTIFSTPLDCADLFSRVEAVPRAHVLAALEQVKTWSDAAGYARHLESLPLGPNVAAFVGHSDLRAHVMGLGRSVDERVRPTKDELRTMERLLDESLAEGLLGLSTMSNPWDKLAGDRWRSRSLPSTFASWSEYRRLGQVVRRAGRVFQGVPDLVTKVDALGFFLQSLGLPGARRALKTSLLTAADPKATPLVSRLITFAARVLNRLGADLRWQHLPVPFEVYADGIDLVVFEEFGAGQAALHLEDQVQRNALMQDEAYRRRFRKDYERRFSPRVWHRDFHDAEIVACPDASVVGRSFGAVADARGVHPVDAYLDLVVAHGTRLRWRTTIANHRPRELDRLAADPSVQLGFADSGAHLRNMAFYSAPVRLLRRVHEAQEAQEAGRPFLSLERAVHRLTGELADWFGVDAGRLQVGDRADVTVIDPRGLDAALDAYHEAEIPEFGGLSRMVNRSDAAVVATLVAGRTVWERGAFAPDTGVVRAGRFLRAGEARGTVSPAAPRALAHA